MVGIYRTDVHPWHMEWKNGGILWRGKRDIIIGHVIFLTVHGDKGRIFKLSRCYCLMFDMKNIRSFAALNGS